MRYANQKESINIYTIIVAAYWWQKSITLFFASCLLLLLLFNFYRQYKNKKAAALTMLQKQHLLEIKTIQAQLNPHFIFNALSSIQGLMNMGKIDEANYYLSNFSLLMRSTLANSNKMNLTLGEEIKIIEQYLKLEQLRFGFKYVLKIDEALNKSFVELPTLLLQPAIENAIKHGILQKQSEGVISIIFSKTDENIVVKIIDNGIGFVPKKINEGYGIKLMEDRINLINKTLTNANIALQTISNNSGTTVTFTFKQWL